VSGILGDPVLEIPAMSTAPKLTSNALPQIQERLPKSGPGPTPLVAIVGPTASGKSSLGAWLARKYGGEVLACDSTQVYRGFDIGTAKPTPEEREGVPHHLLDLVDPGFAFTAGEYRVRAVAALEDLRHRSRLPILTVGTGLYLRALLEGLADAPARSEELRARLEAGADKHSLQYLHRVLRRLDPEAAIRIGSRDRPKMIRAIEVCLLTGRPLTEVHRAGRARLEGYAPLKIGLQPPRAALYDRIEQRVQTMLDRGWIVEVTGLLRSGIPHNAKPFDFIGYSELRSHLEGTVTLAAATKAISQATRRYAKRQLTWFRKEPLVHWLPGFGDDAAIAAAAERLIAGHLHSNAASGAASV
jgi:tRNA dimethylallyltransferase